MSCVYLTEIRRKIAKLVKGYKLLEMTINNVSRAAAKCNARVTKLEAKTHGAVNDVKNDTIRWLDAQNSRLSRLYDIVGDHGTKIGKLEKAQDGKAGKDDVRAIVVEMANYHKRLKQAEDQLAVIGPHVFGLKCKDISDTIRHFKCSACGYFSPDTRGLNSYSWEFCPVCGRKIVKEDAKC